MKLLVLPLFCMFVSTFAYNIIKDEEFVKSYLNGLHRTYDKRVAPIGDGGPDSPIKVNCTMYILDISKVDDSNMDFTAQFYFRQTWIDSRVRYTGSNDSYILFRNLEDVWSPDVFFTGAREGKLHKIVHPNAMLRIKPNGEVFYSVRLTVRFPCIMDFRNFPHDTQKCQMRIESYSHTKKDIDLEWNGEEAVGYYKDITLFNFDIINCSTSHNIEHVMTGVYKVLHVNLDFQRKFGFFATKLYIPFIILVIVSLLSLWIRAEERGIRLSLLVTILYIMINLSSEVSESIPPAPYTKAIDVWIGFCESLVFAIFLEFIAVALISGKHGNDVAESKGEILMNMESDSKEQSLKSDTLKSHLYKLVNMFDARNGGKGKTDATANRIDRIFRIAFPLIFILFNIIYWSVYCCKSVDE